MNVVRLTRSRPLSSARRKRRLRCGIAAVAASALLVLAACSGSPDAPATVGPTATPDQPETYEPTLPPYTSEVELSAEDEEDVEELLLLIDEFNMLTSTLEEPTTEHAEALSGRVDSEMLSGYIGEMNNAIAADKRTSGAVVSREATVLEYSGKKAIVSICYDFSQYIVSDVDNPGVHLYPNRETLHAYDTVAENNDGQWVLVDRYSSEVECSD